MTKYQVACPACKNPLWVTGDLAGGQMNCPKCHQLFAVPPPQTAGDRAASVLSLAADAGALDAALGYYDTLGVHGVSPESTMAHIQLIEPDGEKEKIAHDTLSRVHSRLMVDLFLYPLWRKEEQPHGSRKVN